MSESAEISVIGTVSALRALDVGEDALRPVVEWVISKHSELTPEDWCRLLGARIADPDGWRDGSRQWWEPISREEFDTRLRVCTIDMRGYPDFYGQSGADQ